MDNQTEYPTRRSNKKSSKQPRGTKGKLIAILITLLIIAAAAVMLMWHMKTQGQSKAFLDKGADLETTVKKDLEQSGIPLTSRKAGNEFTEEIYYLPTKEDANVDVLSSSLTALMEKGHANLGKGWGKIFGYVNVHHITDQLTQYQPMAVSYKWNKSTSAFTKKEFAGKNGSYINQQTGKALTAKDLFTEKADYLGLFQVVQQKILEQSKKGAQIIDEVLAMTPPTEETLKFTYAADKFTVELPSNSFDMKEVSLKYNDIANYINTALVDPAQITTKAFVMDPNKKYISLTFDDGPNATMTPTVLDTLKAKNVKATFFNVGENIAGNEAIDKRIIDEGHVIGNHSWNHPDFTASTTDEVKKQIRDTNKALYLATGVLPKYCRPPYGAVNAASAEAIGMPVIQWSIDSTDWEIANAAQVAQKVIDAAYNGSVILLHDIHPTSVAAVPAIIDGLRAQGYEFISLDQLLGATKPLYQYFGLYNGKSDSRIIE